MRHAQKAKESLKTKEIAGRRLDVHYSLPKEAEYRNKNCVPEDNQGTILFTVNPPADKESAPRVEIDHAQLERVFKQYGEVKCVRDARFDHSGMSRFIEYYDSRHAYAAADDAKAIEEQVKPMILPDANEEQVSSTSIHIKVTWDLSLRLRQKLAKEGGLATRKAADNATSRPPASRGGRRDNRRRDERSRSPRRRSPYRSRSRPRFNRSRSPSRERGRDNKRYRSRSRDQPRSRYEKPPPMDSHSAPMMQYPYQAGAVPMQQPYAMPQNYYQQQPSYLPQQQQQPTSYMPIPYQSMTAPQQQQPYAYAPYQPPQYPASTAAPHVSSQHYSAPYQSNTSYTPMPTHQMTYQAPQQAPVPQPPMPVQQQQHSQQQSMRPPQPYPTHQHANNNNNMTNGTVSAPAPQQPQATTESISSLLDMISRTNK